MATAYSEEVNPGGTGYNRIRLRVEYSGTSATCYIEFRRTSSWSATWGDDGASITFNGQTVSAPYWYTGTVDSTWRTIDSASGFTVPLSGGTFSWHFNNPIQGSVLDCGGTITIASQVTPPSGLSISNITATSDSVSATVSVTAWNGGSSATRFRTLSLCTGQSVSQRKYQRVYGDSTSSTITIDNNTVDSEGNAFTITPNTTYYVTMYASNGDASTGNTSFTQVTTLPAPSAKLYGSVNNQAKRIQKLYGAGTGVLSSCVLTVVSDSANMITGFNAATFVSKLCSAHPEYATEGYLDGKRLRLIMYRDGSTPEVQLFLAEGTVSKAMLANRSSGTEEYGFTVDSSAAYQSVAYVSITSKEFTQVAREIKKLYGSVNGVAKLIYEG